MAAVGSTKDIFRSLQLPMTRSHAITFGNSEDSKGGHSVSRPKDISGIKEDERSTEDTTLHQLKIKKPQFFPKPTTKLTAEEKEQLAKKFALIKQLFNSYKEMLRQQGFDVSNYFVSMQNDRIIYNIPNSEHHSRFTAMLNASAKQIDEPSRRRGMRM